MPGGCGVVPVSRSISSPLPCRGVCVCEWDRSRAWSITASWLPARGLARGEDAVCLSRQPCGTAEPFPPPPSACFCSLLCCRKPAAFQVGQKLCLGCPGLRVCPWLCVCPGPGSAKPPICRGDVGDVDNGGGFYADLNWGLSTKGQHSTCLCGLCLGGTHCCPHCHHLKQCIDKEVGTVGTLIDMQTGGYWLASLIPAL